MIDWHQDGSFTELQTKLSILRRVQSNSLQTHFKIEFNFPTKTSIEMSLYRKYDANQIFVYQHVALCLKNEI